MVFRGMASFGKAGTVRAVDIRRSTVDLPLVIAFFGEAAAVQTVLDLLSGLINICQLDGFVAATCW